MLNNDKPLISLDAITSASPRIPYAPEICDSNSLAANAPLMPGQCESFADKIFSPPIEPKAKYQPSEQDINNFKERIAASANTVNSAAIARYYTDTELNKYAAYEAIEKLSQLCGGNLQAATNAIEERFSPLINAAGLVPKDSMTYKETATLLCDPDTQTQNHGPEKIPNLTQNTLRTSRR